MSRLIKPSPVAVLLAVFLAVFLAPAGAHGIQNIHWEALKVSPSIALTQTWDSNVYSVRDDALLRQVYGMEEMADLITTYTPAVRLGLPFKTHSAQASFSSDIRRYKEHPSENSSTFTGRLHADFNFPWGGLLSIDESYIRGFDERGRDLTAGKDYYYLHRTAVTAGYNAHNRWKVLVDASLADKDYSRTASSYKDRDETRLGVKIYASPSPKTFIFAHLGTAEYRYKDNLASQNMDSSERTVSAGLIWELTGKTWLTAEWGVMEKELENGGTDFDGSAGAVQFKYAVTDKTQVQVSYAKSLSESDVQGGGYIVADQLRIGYSQRITPKITFDAEGSHLTEEYSEPTTVLGETRKREEEVWASTLSLTYAPREWLSLALEWTHIDRDSNMDVLDYNREVFNFSAKVMF